MQTLVSYPCSSFPVLPACLHASLFAVIELLDHTTAGELLPGLQPSSQKDQGGLGDMAHSRASLLEMMGVLIQNKGKELEIPFQLLATFISAFVMIGA